MITTSKEDLWPLYLANHGNVGLRNQLVELYLPIGRRYVSRVIRFLPRSVDRGELESIADEAVLRAVPAWSPDGGSRPEHFVFKWVRKAINRFASRLRKRMAMTVVDEDLRHGGSIASMAAQDGDADGNGVDWVCGILRTHLPPRAVHVMEMTFVDGLSGREIAERCQVTASYVYRIRRDSIRQLQSALLG